LLGPGKDDKRRVELAVVTAIAVAGAVAEGTLLYEFRLPLSRLSNESPYGIGAKPEQSLSLGLRTPKLDTSDTAPTGGRGFGGGAGGFGGGGGGRGGFGGGRTGGDMGDMRGPDPMRAMKELKIWTTLTLAHEPR
jgi:hypothetical protein